MSITIPPEIRAALDARRRQYEALHGTEANPGHVRIVKRAGMAPGTGLPPVLDRKPSVNRTLCGAPMTAADVLPSYAHTAIGVVCPRCLELLKTFRVSRKAWVQP